MADILYIESIHDARQQMRNYGLVVDDLVADGQIQRVSTAHDKGSGKSGWYSIKEHLIDGKRVYSGVYGDWRGGYVVSFQTGDDTPEIRLHLRQAAEQAKLEKARRAVIARKEATRLWTRESKFLTQHEASQHAYMLKKQIVAPCPMRRLNQQLCLPITRFDEQGIEHLLSLQVIDPEGKKMFIPKHAPVEGGSFILPGIEFPDTSLIVEGFATGVSCWMATGCEVIITFNAVNMLAACKALLAAGKLKPNRIVCADDDEATYRKFVENAHPRPLNPGLNAGRETAALLLGRMSWPRFKNRESCLELSDFNDLHVREGLNEVKRQLEPLLR